MTPGAEPRLDGFKAISGSRSMRGILSVRDLEARARAILPKAVFSYVSGGVEDNRAMENNERAFRNYAMKTRVLVDSTDRDQSVTLFGETYRVPFGIAPMGAVGLGRHKGDLALAGAAHQTGQIYVLSASSTEPLESILKVNPRTWFQTYLLKDRKELRAIMDRAANAGVKTLVITVDIPVPGNRENNIRNGYDMPFRITPKIVLDGLAHPRWLAGVYLRNTLGPERLFFENQGSDRIEVFSKNASINIRRDNITWEDFQYIRALWKGHLIVKGVLSVEDAVTARDLGGDGVIVSNHGGRQLDVSLTPLDILPDIVEALPGFPILVDGGFRRGTDAMIGQALGAHAILMGRPYYYAAAIGGENAAVHFSRLMANEIDRTLAMCGVHRPHQLQNLIHTIRT